MGTTKTWQTWCSAPSQLGGPVHKAPKLRVGWVAPPLSWARVGGRLDSVMLWLANEPPTPSAWATHCRQPIVGGGWPGAPPPAGGGWPSPPPTVGGGCPGNPPTVGGGVCGIVCLALKLRGPWAPHWRPTHIHPRALLVLAQLCMGQLWGTPWHLQKLKDKLD